MWTVKSSLCFGGWNPASGMYKVTLSENPLNLKRRSVDSAVH